MGEAGLDPFDSYVVYFSIVSLIVKYFSDRATLEGPHVVVLQTCLVHFSQEDFAAGVECWVMLISCVFGCIMASYDGAHILHMSL